MSTPRWFALLVVASGCANGNGFTRPQGTFEAQALAIAAEYKRWGRVDDEFRWAPAKCVQPLAGVARMSASTDAETHGQKLYSLFVKERSQYPMGSTTGQVVVKESWTAEPVTDAPDRHDPAAPWQQPGADDHFYPYAKKGETTYRAARPAGLFIMFKVDPPTPDSNDGWIYATIAPGGQVTGAGRMAPCMACHHEAPHGRLFGVPKSPSD